MIGEVPRCLSVQTTVRHKAVMVLSMMTFHVSKQRYSKHLDTK